MWSCSVRRRLIDAQPFEEPWSIARFAKDGRSLTPEEFEEARRLLRAARSDLRALEALATDPEQEHDVRLNRRESDRDGSEGLDAR